MRKRSLLLLTTFMMTVGILAGCSSNNEATVSTTQEVHTAAEIEAEMELESSSPATEEAASEAVSTKGTSAEGAEGKTLVVYFSATGNTERVAEAIVEVTGGDLFELGPAVPYTDEDLNYTDDNSRVSQEYADENLRNVELVAATVEGFDEYETVFVGYPVWWAIAAWPVNTFVETNDFIGKTVIPLCTSASSGLGQSGELLAGRNTVPVERIGRRCSSLGGEFGDVII